MLNLYFVDVMKALTGLYLASLCVLSSDDEEVSLVIESACPMGGNAANGFHAADAPDDDTLSVGPDMPDLPLDAPPDPITFVPQASTVIASPPEEVLPVDNEEAGATDEVEPGILEEESTVREDAPSTEMEQGEGALAEQQEENSGEGGAQREREMGEEEAQQAESATQAVEEVEEKEGEQEAEPKSDSDNAVAGPTNNGAATVETTQGQIASQEAVVGLVEGAPHEFAVGEGRSCVPCTCQSLFTTYNSHAPLRRKNRPCSLPVSELETVIASACGEPETPRSHYIRIHHLLHSLPSAQHRPPSQEEEETGEGENTSITQDITSTSPTLKTSKEEGQDDEEEEDTTQSPSQVLPRMDCRIGKSGHITQNSTNCCF